MTLKQQMAADAELFLNLEEFGEKVSWIPSGQDPIADPVAISFHQGSMIVAGQVIAIETEASILVAREAIPDPSAGARFVRADGVSWFVDKSGVQGADQVFWKLSCHLDPLPTMRSW